MAREAILFIQILTYATLICFSHGVPLIGKNVKDARTNELPFVVSLAKRAPNNTNFQNRHFCTGTLISKKNVLTAAHCLEKKRIEEVEIIVGSVDVRLGKKYYPKSWITFDKWKNNVDSERSLNDIAVMTLDGDGTSNITPAPILTFNPTDLYKSTVRIAGWGIAEDGKRPLILKTAVLTVISNEECNSKATKLIGKQFSVPQNYFCSLADPWVVATCGDSGAPILNKRNQLVGIHIGVCPNLKGYPPEFRNQNLLNSHLHLYNYREFIGHVKI